MIDLATEESLWETEKPDTQKCCICETAVNGNRMWELRPTGVGRKNQLWAYCPECWDFARGHVKKVKEWRLMVEALSHHSLGDDGEHHVWLPDESSRES
jgi:hypothetical protein